MTISHPIGSIARLTIRTAVRSRTFAWLLAATLGITLGLPLLLRGDGTAAGHMRMVIIYPTAMLFAVLVIGTLWLSAGLVSLEISNRQLQSVAVKPVRAFDIWLGKWLGVVAMSGCLVAAATLGLLLSINRTTQRYAGSPEDVAVLQEEILVGRRMITPELPVELAESAERLRLTLVAEGRTPEPAHMNRVLQEMKARRAIVAPGTTISWTLKLPANSLRRESREKRSLRYQFRCDPGERVPISGSWTLSAEGCAPVEFTVTDVLDGTHHLAIPDSFQPDSDTVTATFARETGADAPYLFFDAHTPVVLLVHESGFAMNLARGMLAIIGFLAAVAAIGLSVGTVFSFPVALFTGGALLFALTLAAGFSEGPPEHSHGPESTPGLITRTAEPVLLAIKHATANLVDNIPVAALGDGMLFSWRQTGECIVLLLLLLPAILGALSALLLSQKELAA